MALPSNPLTREEQYLSAIAGEDTLIPSKPVTRIEQYLDYIAVNGTGRGGYGGKIKGAYDTLAELETDHPTGSDGDAYLVGTTSIHVYLWVEEEGWTDGGAFAAIEGPRGPKGEKGDDGESPDMTDYYTKTETDEKISSLIDDTSSSSSKTYSSEKIEEIISDIPTEGIIDDTSASANKTYSSNKIESIISPIETKTNHITTVEQGTNLIIPSDCKDNWKPNTTTGVSTYDEGSETSYLTTNLFICHSNDKFKFNMTSAPTYFRVFCYNADKVYIGGSAEIAFDADGYAYVQPRMGTTYGAMAYACLVYTRTAFDYNNLVLMPYSEWSPNSETHIDDFQFTSRMYEDIKNNIGDILNGKKWAVCGDSFSAGDFTGLTGGYTITSGKYAGQKAVYPYLIGNRRNMDIVSLMQGGRTLASPSDESFSNCFSLVYQNVPIDADYITLYFGINDSHHRPNHSGSDGEDETGEIQIGTITDSTINTFYGAWNVVLAWLIENRPNAKIGIIVSNACETDDYRVATIACAKKWGIPYIDLNGDERTQAMIRSTNTNLSASALAIINEKWRVSSTNGHPNVACHEFESTIIENFLRTL